jgi:hypothetical protein
MFNFYLICIRLILSVPSFAQDRTFHLMPAPRLLIAAENLFQIVQNVSIGVIRNHSDKVYKEATRTF